MFDLQLLFYYHPYGRVMCLRVLSFHDIRIQNWDILGITGWQTLLTCAFRTLRISLPHNPCKKNRYPTPWLDKAPISPSINEMQVSSAQLPDIELPAPLNSAHL
jgi:hypothetical protein